MKEKPCCHLSLSVELENADKNRLSDNSVPLRPSERKKMTDKMGPYRGRNGWKQQVGFEKVKTKVHTPDNKRERKHYEMQKQKQET